MDLLVTPARGPLRGELRVPGDKSVSHRAVILAALAEGTSRLTGLLDSEDVRSTISAVIALGASVRDTGGAIEVTGWGTGGASEAAGPIDCGNSGTTVRLLAGVAAGWPIATTFTGDASLSKRPMERVAEPLRGMGAEVATTDSHLPMTIRGTALRAITYDSPVASAQVKSLVLLAGLRAAGRTTVTEPAASRDHTERMLPTFGVDVARSADGLTASVEGPATPHACDVDLPADPSAATFFAAAAAMVQGSRISLPGLLLNPRRTAALDMLSRMGAQLEIEQTGQAAGEDTGSLTVSSARGLIAATVRAADVPALIDEIPILAIVATQARGTTRFEGVAELRVKESDRLQAIEDALTALGAEVRAGEDWLEIEGPATLRGGVSLDSIGDHRLAMAFHVAALVASGPLRIGHYDAVSVSYPGFASDLGRLLADEGADA